MSILMINRYKIINKLKIFRLKDVEDQNQHIKYKKQKNLKINIK